MTPREIARVFEGKARAARMRHDQRMEAAWTTAMLGRSKKPIPLKQLLSPSAAKPVRQSWQSMYAACASWAGAVGEIRSEGQTA